MNWFEAFLIFYLSFGAGSGLGFLVYRDDGDQRGLRENERFYAFLAFFFLWPVPLYYAYKDEGEDYR